MIESMSQAIMKIKRQEKKKKTTNSNKSIKWEHKLTIYINLYFHFKKLNF